ncbi:hypothetical protein [Pseudomonas sp. Marseille-Q5115]|uniref:hypothetical protein n=1 Tax=Pseudomonas sp. Marseille-Q5115 TaxID=2866593 RepID=UPI001CE49AD2|nr:hypothetical protein [Pseudomonas sp. Marseille-Q5115]
MSANENDPNPTPEWPLNAPSDPVELNDTGFDPARDPLDDAAADDSDLDPDLSEPDA